MKHPKYRCKDILFMDKDAVREVFSFVWECAKVLPFYDKIADIELVGSYAFGTNRLGSDMDFNIAMKDYNDQIPAKQWFFTGSNRLEFSNKVNEFEKKYGLHLDVGCVDPSSVKYNVCASTKKFELYNRGREPLPIIQRGLATAFPLFTDEPLSIINILDFDPTKDSAPSVFLQHLRFDPYVYYFLGEDRNFPRRSQWAFDEWADVAPEWEKLYGDRYQSYHVEGEQLVAD